MPNKRRVGHRFDDGVSSANKTYLDLPSFAEPPEYSIVVSADDDEYAGRTKVLQKVRRSSLALMLMLNANAPPPPSSLPFSIFTRDNICQ